MRLVFLFIVVALGCGCSSSAPTILSSSPLASPTSSRAPTVLAPISWEMEPAVTFVPDFVSVANEKPLSWRDSSLCAGMIQTNVGGVPWHYYWRNYWELALVRDLALDGDWLWVATPQALLRIHRPTLTCERLDESAGAPASHLAGATGLVVDAEGWLWVVGPNGLVRHRAGVWEVVSEEDMVGFALDLEGDLWRINWADYGRWGEYYARRLASDADDDWIWDDDLLEECRWRVLVKRRHKYGSLTECQNIQRQLDKGLRRTNEPAVVTSQGQVWLATSFSDRQDLLRIAPDNAGEKGGKGETIDWPYDRITALAADDVSDGVWIGTFNGLAYAEDGAVRFYALLDGDWPLLAPFSTDSLAVTGDGLVWIGSTEGVVYLDSARMVMREFLSGRPARVGADGQGGMWLWTRDGEYGDVLAHYDAGMWRWWQLPRAWVLPGLVTDMQVADGQVWLLVSVGGLIRFDEQTWYLLRYDWPFEKLALVPGGEAYIRVYAGGPPAYDERNWHPVFGTESLQLSRPLDIMLAADTRGGIWGFNQGEVYYLYKGTEHNTHYNGRWIESALLDSRGWLWVGTCGSVWRYASPSGYPDDDGKWEEYPGSGCTRTLVEDAQGRVWVGSEYSLKMTDPSTWEEP